VQIPRAGSPREDEITKHRLRRFYIDSTPTHSYMKDLYKYPQREYPYRDLIATNRRRSREELLLETERASLADRLVREQVGGEATRK
jgi:hypothetical protein